MASALLEALAIPAAEMNMLRLQFPQLNIQLQQRMKKSVEPPGCQTKISCMVTYSYSTWGLFVQNQQLKEDPCRHKGVSVCAAQENRDGCGVSIHSSRCHCFEVVLMV